MIRALALAAALFAAPALAVQPDEVLDDPALEARARELSTGLRCLVCRNESIDESNADLARDMRILLRERLVEGDTDAEAVAFLGRRAAAGPAGAEGLSEDEKARLARLLRD